MLYLVPPWGIHGVLGGQISLEAHSKFGGGGVGEDRTAYSVVQLEYGVEYLYERYHFRVGGKGKTGRGERA